MIHHLKIRFVFYLLLIGSNFGFSQSMSQGLIFGKIELKNGDTLKGQIRWDNEQGVWEDEFTAIRYNNPVYDALGKEKAKKIKTKTRDFDFGFMQLWEDKVSDSEPTFSCSFGDIAYLKSSKGDMVLLGLKNGANVKLNMDKNGDLDDRIFLYEKSAKRHVLYFKEIRSIRFMPFEMDYVPARGNPMYANVLTSMGAFKGYISWDREERFENDDIEGKNKDKKKHIPFKNIAKIKAQDDGSLITMVSGREIFLNNHDDVDDGNHGIVVIGQEFGMVEIEWENFISASFKRTSSVPRPYGDFKKAKLLKGVVEDNSGEKFHGQLIFNLNKMYYIEFLNGENNGYEYNIPFYKIDKIEPQNDKYTMVTLKTESSLLLGDDDDVTKNNGGVVVKSKKGDARYVAWANIKKISFE